MSGQGCEQHPPGSPPQGIVFELPGGDLTLDSFMHYDGERDGQHHWTIYGPPGAAWFGNPPTLRVAVLPARTTLHVAMAPDAQSPGWHRLLTYDEAHGPAYDWFMNEGKGYP